MKFEGLVWIVEKKSPNKPEDHRAYYVIVGKTTKTVWREDPDGLLTLVKLDGVPYPPKK